MTYGRPKYIERSFESLYKRAGYVFDHFVFDDNSDEETQIVLEKLKAKYKFVLYKNEERLDIYRSFHKNIKKISKNYDYYVKMDSDIELLSDNMLPLLLENFNLNKKVSGMTPRIEGVLEHERRTNEIEFLNGHAVKLRFPVAYGCFMIFPKKVFSSFEVLSDSEIRDMQCRWGVDTKLYEHALQYGEFIIIEDLSVYHIDNTYGQRRVDDKYFTERKRWSKIDNDEVWYMNASKIISPCFITREVYDSIKRISSDYDDFIENCKSHINDNSFLQLRNERRNEIEKQEKKQDEISREDRRRKIEKIKKYKISSPINFRSDPHMMHGSEEIHDEIPIWAKNNPRVIIEEIYIEVK
ncbi:glycosyltransferase [bacterium]|nr:glycosyltransferase [bacterium]